MPTSTRDRDRAPSAPLAVFGLASLLVGLAASAAVPASDRGLLLVSVAGAAGLGLAFLAATRFELFVALALVFRASMDIAKLGSSSIDTTGAFSLLFIAASTIWLVVQQRDAAHQEASPLAPLFPPLAVFFLIGLLGIPFANEPNATLLETVRFGTLIVIVGVLGRIIRDERTLRLILVAVLASALIPVLVGAQQLASGGLFVNPDGLSRVRGTFAHSNPFAAYLFLVITLSAAVFPHVRLRWKAPIGLLVIVSGGMLVATYARGAWLATAMALVIIALIQDRRLFWLMLAGVLVVALTVPSVSSRLGNLSQAQKDSGAPGNSLIWRFQYWQQILRLQTNPVLGIGLKQVELSDEGTVAPHNDLVRVYVETGFLGLLAYVWLFGALIIAARAALRRAPPGLARGLAVAFAASLAGLILLSLAANVITQLVILWYFMAIAAMAVCASEFAPERQAAE